MSSGAPLTPLASLASMADAKVLPFRRHQGAVRIRRRKVWVALVRPLAQAAALVGGITGLLYWILASPSFAVRELEVDGLEHLSRSWTEAALRPVVGENLPLLELSTVSARLSTSPWVESVAIEKRLPDRLRVTVHERRPAALLRRGQELIYLDSEGRFIAPYDPARGPADLLLVSVGAPATENFARVFALAAEIAANDAEWGEGLSEIELVGEEDFRFFTAALPFPVLAQAGKMSERAASLRALVPEILRRYGEVRSVDLRFARGIIVEPMAVPAGVPASADVETL